jgi:hypothetical protein
MSKAVCPPVTQTQVESLTGLVQRHGMAEVIAAMDRGASDEFWADKLDLDQFVSKFARFLPRNAPPKKPTATAPAADHTQFTGGRRAI